MPYWTLILLAALVVFFTVIIVCIVRMIRKNKDHSQAQELAILQELQAAKAEGLDIPEDLEKRLARFEQREEWKDDMDGKKSDKKLAKVHPDHCAANGKGRDKLTRYAVNSQNSAAKLKSSFATSPVGMNQIDDCAKPRGRLTRNVRIKGK